MLNKERFPRQLVPQIEKYAAAFNSLPCAVIIHDLRDWSVVYMSNRGLQLLQSTHEEITALSSGDYYKKYFNQEDAEDYVPKILSLLERNNDDELVTFFQQVRFPGRDEWSWHMSSVKIFMRDEAGKPSLTITIAVPIDAMHHMTAKAERLLLDNNFLRQNYEKFSKLTKREKEVLTQVASGKSAAEIANALYISVTTAETHRKNIKQKLSASTYQLMQYARAFDLV
ncbi:MAG: helix-turn-helix transcriptional regulator [Mucilaginibacter sp.]|jgi:DNA-binding CsgD family transcriptional regulator|uniref:response regulator transcription factor n=1 Tax=Mucilaginibacter sp. TaxID=1882438 RepID=UPI003569E698